MKIFLVLTIDVEPDCSRNWSYSNPLQFEGISNGIAEKLQPLFIDHGIVPTYLINNVVLENAPSVDVLRKLPGKYELGTHLHPEFMEPEKEFYDYAGKKAEKNCCYYPEAIESEKILNITDLFVNAFGYRPTSFRAGRFSAGNNTMASLRKSGYLVDSSVTPHILWNDSSRKTPIDYRQAPVQPYFMSEKNLLEQNSEGDLLQVPVSIGLNKRNIIKELLASGAGLLHPVRKYKPIWLRPFYSRTKEMIGLVREFMKTYQDQEWMVLNMMFHNVEVLPGISPYTQTENECRQYLRQLKDFFIFCQQEKIQSVALSQLYDIFRKK